METSFQQPYRTGDEVQIVQSSRKRELGEYHIIHEVNIEEDEYQYSTNRGAWYDHQQFKLVRECCAETMAQLRKSIQDEEDSNYEG